MGPSDVQQLAKRIREAIDDVVALRRDPEHNLFLLPPGSFILERHGETSVQVLLDRNTKAAFRIDFHEGAVVYTLLIDGGKRYTLPVPIDRAREFTHYLEGAYLIDMPESNTSHLRLVIGH